MIEQVVIQDKYFRERNDTKCQSMFNEDPYISYEATDAYKEYEAIIIEQIDGKY